MADPLRLPEIGEFLYDCLDCGLVVTLHAHTTTELAFALYVHDLQH